MDLRTKSLNFLLEWINKNHIPSIRKGMVEDLERFVTDIASQVEIQGAVNRMANSPLKQELEAVKAEKNKQVEAAKES
jgi:hypothetical protein